MNEKFNYTEFLTSPIGDTDTWLIGPEIGDLLVL